MTALLCAEALKLDARIVVPRAAGVMSASKFWNNLAMSR